MHHQNPGRSLKVYQCQHLVNIKQLQLVGLPDLKAKYRYHPITEILGQRGNPVEFGFQFLFHQVANIKQQLYKMGISTSRAITVKPGRFMHPMTT
jgi:hypothetical protein